MTVPLSLSHPVNGVYLQLSKRAGLIFLLSYAVGHKSCRQWIGPLTLLLSRAEGRP